ncbi:MAG: hypothetical protein RL291_1055, partial [Pseudomonadota bacterium]
MIFNARRLVVGAGALIALAGSTLSAQQMGPRVRGTDVTIGGVFADDFGLPVQLTGFDGWFIQTRTQRLWTPEISFFGGLPSIFGSTSTCGRGGCGSAAVARGTSLTATVNTSSAAGAPSQGAGASQPGGTVPPNTNSLEPWNLPGLPVLVAPEPSTFALLATSLV